MVYPISGFSSVYTSVFRIRILLGTLNLFKNVVLSLVIEKYLMESYQRNLNLKNFPENKVSKNHVKSNCIKRKIY